MKIPHIHTNSGISAFLCGRQYIVSNEVTYFPDFLKAIQEDDDEVLALEILNSNLKRMTEAVKLTEDITVVGGQVMYQGEPVEPVISERMVTMLNENKPMQFMVNFLENLMQNPSYRATQQLYPFIGFGSNPITPDGCFLAYKAVRANFFDIHSGKFDNSIGAKPSMARNKVDENPDRTCSNGLHVCSFGYLPHFSHDNGHVMVVKVNPRDVVAIPADYNNTKMRVSTYEVVAEYHGYYLEHPECAFRTSVVDDFEQFGDTRDGYGEPTFAVDVFRNCDNYADGTPEEDINRTGLDLKQAKTLALDLDPADFYRVVVRNEHDDTEPMTLNGELS